MAARVDMSAGVEKYLADNSPDEWEGEEPMPEAEPTDKRDLVKHLRKVINELQRRRDEQVAEAFTSGYKLGAAAERRKITAETTARELGLTGQVITAFFKMHPREEPTTEALLAFAAGLGLNPNTNGDMPTPPEKPPDEQEPEPAKVRIWPPSEGGPAPVATTQAAPAEPAASASEPSPPPRKRKKGA